MRIRVATALSIVSLAAAAACGGGSSGGGGGATNTPAASSTAPTDPAAAKQQIITTWMTFFNSKTPHATSVTLLQDGSQLGAAITAAAKFAKSQHLTEKAKVTKVDFTSPTTATVTYALVGTPLTNATGEAVLVNGKWLVAKNTFCGLVSAIGGKKVSGC